jgi:hypothetical protein
MRLRQRPRERDAFPLIVSSLFLLGVASFIADVLLRG